MASDEFNSFEDEIERALKSAQNPEDLTNQNDSDRGSKHLTSENKLSIKNDQGKESNVIIESVTASAPELNVEYIEALNRLQGKKRSFRRHDFDERTKNGSRIDDSCLSKGLSQFEDGEKQKKYLRTAAGKIWEDKTLADWPENDFRLWVGQLGPDTKDETLKACFDKYESFNRTRVVLDHRTGECRGYGFVSFSDPMEMVKAMRENQGKYCGSRRMTIKRSEREKRDLKLVRKHNEKIAKLHKKLGII